MTSWDADLKLSSQSLCHLWQVDPPPGTLAGSLTPLRGRSCQGGKNVTWIYISHEVQKWHLADYPFKQRFDYALLIHTYNLHYRVCVCRYSETALCSRSLTLQSNSARGAPHLGMLGAGFGTACYLSGSFPLFHGEQFSLSASLSFIMNQYEQLKRKSC